MVHASLVYREDVYPYLVLRLRYPSPIQDARVVDQHVDAPLLLEDAFDDRVPLLRVGHVVLEKGRADAGCRLLALRRQDVGQIDDGTLSGEPRALSRALAPGAARDDRD